MKLCRLLPIVVLLASVACFHGHPQAVPKTEPVELQVQVNTPFHFVAYGDSRFHDPKDTEGANPPVRQAGLGLAIAKWITDSHHARLSVTSKENAGAVFELVLPVCIVDSSLPKAASIAASVANLG